MNKILVGILILLTCWSCKDEVTKSLTPKPVALGRLNDVVAVCDDKVWDGMIGDTFVYYYESAYPVMPSPEPLFDIRHFSAENLAAEPLRRELRTYVILANLKDTESATTKMVRRDLGEERYKKALVDTSFFSSVGRDKWAREQFVAYIFGNGLDDLARAIEKSFPAIANRIKKHDHVQLASNVYNLKAEDPEIKSILQDKFGVYLKVPGDYKKQVETDKNFVMLKRDFKDYSQSIVIRKFPYRDAKQLSKEGIVEMRNDYGLEFISGVSEGSYMRTNDDALPVYEYTTEINGYYTKELRGIWELTNDYIGGPFVTYVMLNKDTNQLIFIDTFVYAPSRGKRDLIQQLEHIMQSAKFVGVSSE